MSATYDTHHIEGTINLAIQRPIQSPAGLKPAASAAARVANVRVQFPQLALRHVGR